MTASIIDSEFYGDGWSTAELRTVFDSRRRYQRWLDVEAALARVQGRLGVIPEKAAQEISAQAKIERIDMDKLKEELKQTQHSLMPLLRGLQRVCENNYGEFIHYGATTQDIEDTGMILELKDAWNILFRDLRTAEALLIDLSVRHRDEVMAGRTHGQQALPITLGLKFAIWASEIRRHLERFKEMRNRLFVVMLHGGAGTAAALGPKAVETIHLFAKELNLGMPDAGWGNARDNMAEYAVCVAMAAATIGKISNEIFELGRSETGEFSEALPEGYVGSSTMPHKRNPEICEQVVMLSRVIRSHATVAIEAIGCANERDSRSWRTDWWSLPECSMMFGAMLAMTNKLLATMNIHHDRIAENLDLQKGLLLSEGLMFLLGGKIGKQTAHHVVSRACRIAFENGRPLKEALLEMEEFTSRLSRQEIEDLFDYDKHVGAAGAFVDAVAATSRRLRKSDENLMNGN
ncbi:MAG: adenylosuccinate lyase family protein [Deltaproteobacteria bacterium]|nr:adenylosuccinate lyase family protein [Deltaproteobacteria bacterium]